MGRRADVFWSMFENEIFGLKVEVGQEEQVSSANCNLKSGSLTGSGVEVRASAPPKRDSPVRGRILPGLPVEESCTLILVHQAGEITANGQCSDSLHSLGRVRWFSK